jgi:rhodanese-related sulfurtransferase
MAGTANRQAPAGPAFHVIAAEGKSKMRKLIFVTLGAVLAGPIVQMPAPMTAAAQTRATAPSPATDPTYTYKTIRLNRAALDTLLAKPEQLLFIDLRRPDEVTSVGGLPVYLSIQVKDLEKSLAFIPANRTIVTVSNRAHRAGAAGDLLAAHGFNVAGAIGAQDYEAEGGTITRIAPRSATATPPSAGVPAVASNPSDKR